MREADAGAQARWDRAAQMAEGLTDLGIGGAVRRYFLVIVPLTFVIALGVGFALAAFWPEIYDDFFHTGVYLGLMLAGVGVSVVGLVYRSRTVGAMVRPRQIGVTVGLKGDEVKHVRRQILAKDPIDLTQLTVLKAAAVQFREKLAKQLLTSPGIVIFLSGQAAARGIRSGFDVMIIAVLLVMVGLVGSLAHQFRRTGVFLAATGPAAADDSNPQS
ncbi:hypothetical protein IV498_07880 [Paenarthrobacter sp. Z7-10]|uniref:hypothetical protein n=1 Tax=Paenarthrobacter sp. Z7-10 TaxID=2787635 RepID=UPI0022A9F59C|nr:hypothetical protein [Paenarthrobacter sp. Z7-10]MCZ2403102.1 hypothetical protein [Paenarthrobacter sp. Z7-10]